MAVTLRLVLASPLASSVSFSRGLRLPASSRLRWPFNKNNNEDTTVSTASKQEPSEKPISFEGFGGLTRSGSVPEAQPPPKRQRPRRVTALGRATFRFPIVKKVHRPQYHLRVRHHGKPEENFPATPRELNTNVLDFVQRRDMWMRRKQLDIPFFCTGSYLAVTHSDPWHPQGYARFVGICICIRYRRMGTTFILRNHIEGHGIEKTFELYSPFIQKIEVLKLERRRRSKLYYLRELSPKMSAVKFDMRPIPLPAGYTGRHRGQVPKYKRRSKEG